MELFALLTLGILAGQLASLFFGGYSLGAVGNGIAGITGAIFIGKYITLLFGMPTYFAMFAGGVAGAFAILAVFSVAESLTSSKKSRLF